MTSLKDQIRTVLDNAQISTNNYDLSVSEHGHDQYARINVWDITVPQAQKLRKIAAQMTMIRRDHFGDMLDGGNTVVRVDYDPHFVERLAKDKQILAAMEAAKADPGLCVKIKGFRGFEVSYDQHSDMHRVYHYDNYRGSTRSAYSNLPPAVLAAWAILGAE